ncbi:hypothetical protein EJ110_NYTH39997 [Nymphaea thermarum]|nr:hypothetical protein EJ110_NYTH39997 [Nymphaea thermarum]
MISHFFALHVMCPLLGYTHIDAGRQVRVSKEFLEEVEKRIIGLRPVWRVDAAKVNTFCDYALLMSDHSLFSHAEANAIKKKVSRFKMHQALKFHQGEVLILSTCYRSLDLNQTAIDFERIFVKLKSSFA